MRRMLRLGLTSLLVAAVVVGATIGGMVVGLNAFGDQRHETEFGSLDSRVRADLDGHVTVYVPLVDWRVRLLEHRAPASIELEVRGIDRERAGRGISSADAATRSLSAVQADSERVIRDTVQRAVIAAGAGGLVGALIAGMLLTATRLRRRWLLVAPLIGTAVMALVLVPTVRSLARLSDQHVQVTAAGGHADELPVVLRFAEQLLDVGPEYSRHYETALRSVVNIAGFARDAGDEVDAPDTRVLVFSDLHDNVFVLDAFDEYAGDATVIGVGDFVQVGARIEERTAPRVAALGGRMVAVSGNHDTPEYMRSLAQGGATVLDLEQPTIEVDGLRLAGWPDPLERSDDSRGEHRLRVYGREYEQQRDAFIEWWEALEERPDVVLVHQHGFAHRLVQHLEDQGDREPLVILTGHDHQMHVHAEGPHVIVDAGTLGAGGLAAVGEQDATFAQLELTDGTLTGVLLVSIEPLTGTARSERISIR